MSNTIKINVLWDKDDHVELECGVPVPRALYEQDVASDFDQQEVAEYLSDTYGWLVQDWSEDEITEAKA